MITQNIQLVVFFSQNEKNTAQHKYSVTEAEILFIVECTRDIKGIFWGQTLKVYADHRNIVQDALGLTCNCIY